MTSGRRWDYQGDDETFGGEGYVHYHECDVFTDVFICQNLLDCVFK